jgi:hypothetical protein
MCRRQSSTRLAPSLRGHANPLHRGSSLGGPYEKRIPREGFSTLLFVVGAFGTSCVVGLFARASLARLATRHKRCAAATVLAESGGIIRFGIVTITGLAIGVGVGESDGMKQV